VATLVSEEFDTKLESVNTAKDEIFVSYSSQIIYKYHKLIKFIDFRLQFISLKVLGILNPLL